MTSGERDEREATSQSSAVIRMRDSGLRWRRSPPDLPESDFMWRINPTVKIFTSVIFDELDHVTPLVLTEAASDDVPPGEVVQRCEAVLAHRVDVVLRDGCGL